MDDFRFQNPMAINWLWLVVVLIGFLIWLEFRSRSILDQFLSKKMQSRLTQAVGRPRRIVSLLLLGAAMLFGVIALMRPQLGFIDQPVQRYSAQIMVCLDVSRSMLAEDSKPNRLERAKAELLDMFGLLENDEVGLTAFAGKATVICPMTSDFAFLKLLLDDVGTHSVGLGGTKLAEPIKKAVQGFGEAADISRVILLITDGEDQDSFPLEAAMEAREKGIKIITIGFGDENGSRIEVTNPQSGETDFVRDSDGQPVVSRLDGDLLRELALKTDGAYIPAGTGALDLESIYREHIAGLIRNNLESTKQLIRNEAFQFPIVIAVLCLFSSLMVRSSGMKMQSSLAISSSKLTHVAILLVCFVCIFGDSTVAEESSETPPKTEQNDQAESDDPSSISSKRNADSNEQDKDPRTLYNEALAFLHSDLDRAESMLTSARRHAGSDGEVRFRSAYNLGWVFVHKANTQLKDDPQQALEHLQASADWFSRAIQIRPKDVDARHNLEIVMRRRLELADALHKKDKDYAKQLDELITAARRAVDETGSLAEQIRGSNQTDPDAKLFQQDFRKLAVEQRILMADAQRLLDQANRELDSLEKNKTEESSDAQQMKIGQLVYSTNYLQQSIQRMGQARSQLRFRQQLRAHRRQSAALDRLKRARDAFRDPGERIQLLISDASSVYQNTSKLTTKNSIGHSPDTDVPAWLTNELIQENQDSISERTVELGGQLQSSQQTTTDEEQSTETTNETGTSQVDKQTQREVTELVLQAGEKFQQASAALQSNRLTDATQFQLDALKQLQQAAERLLQLRGLIETVHQVEIGIQDILRQITSMSEQDFVQRLEFASERQANNIDRMKRIVKMLDTQIADLDAPTTDNPSASPTSPRPESDDAKKQQREHLETAKSLSIKIQKTMSSARSEFAESLKERSKKDSAKDSVLGVLKGLATDAVFDTSRRIRYRLGLSKSPGAERVDEAVQQIQELRRMFFSIVEHLREAAHRQANLNDQTEFLSRLPDSKRDLSKRGPLAQRQADIQQKAEVISEELGKQAQGSPESGDPPEGHDQMLQKFQQASQLVFDATRHMNQSIEQLMMSRDQNNQDPKSNHFDLKKTCEQQDNALQKLMEALQLLQPPQDQNENQEQQQNQEQDNSNSTNQPNPSENEQAGTNRVLQMIRDRERNRLDEKRRRAMRNSNRAVESDW